MPWAAKDVRRHNRAAAGSRIKRKQWTTVANKVLAESHDEGKAVRIANAAVRKGRRGKR